MGHWVCKFPKEMLAALLSRVSRENAEQAPTRLMCNRSCQPSHSGARLSTLRRILATRSTAVQRRPERWMMVRRVLESLVSAADNA